MRRRILKNQRQANYQTEFDKIKGIRDHTITPKGHSLQSYKDRINYLEKMGASAVEGIK